MGEPDNAAVLEYGDELSLLWCVLLNTVVFGTAHRFAIRRITRDRVQATLDAALLGYAIQYASVCLPGALGALRPSTMTAAAVLLSAILWAASLRPQRQTQFTTPAEPVSVSSPWSPWVILVVALFLIGYLLSFARMQNVLPVMSNDALTYHFPAAVQWLQTGRLGLFPTWFFNPANTYSPLAGSTFIAWLIAPFDNDVLARFVEMPALLVVVAGMFQLCRQLRVESGTAALIAGAAAISRPLLFPSIMGKDDLFVAAFFLCALLAMTPDRARERFGWLRFGTALGLLLATKYTALLCLPLLLLAIDGLWKAGWRWRQSAVAGTVVVLLAGPWYWRNFWLTGNPLFPVDVSIAGLHVFRGLFTLGRSESFRTIGGSWDVLTGGDYGLPPVLMVVVCAACLAVMILHRQILGRDTIRRVCLFGPVAGLAIFFWRSPFPEVRFALPSFLLLFACLAAAIEFVAPPVWAKQTIGFVVFILTWWTALANRDENIHFALDGVAFAVVGFIAMWTTRRWRPSVRLAVVGGGTLIVMLGFTFVYWSASLQAYRKALFVEGSGWELSYPAKKPLWQFVAEHVPRDATVAYANLYMVYPLQGFTLDRRVVYAPTRPGVRSLADLPWLGERLPGERLVPLTTAATVANADRATWLKKLRELSAQYLVVGKGGTIASPPEAVFAASDARRFRKLFENDGGIVYAIDWPSGE